MSVISIPRRLRQEGLHGETLSHPTPSKNNNQKWSWGGGLVVKSMQCS